MPKNQKESEDLKKSVNFDKNPNTVSIEDIPLISDQAKEKIYGQAYRLYNTGKLEEAAKLFQLLIMIDAQNPKYAMGLGATHQMLKQYQYAIDSYTQCSLIDPENPIPYFHTADCFLKLNDLGSAIINLELAVEHSAGSPQFVKLQERAKLTIEALKKQLGLPETESKSKPAVKVKKGLKKKK